MTKLLLGPLMEAGGYETAGELARVLGVSNDNVRSMKNRGVPIHRADDFAGKCGLHPIEVWGDAFYAALHEGDEPLNPWCFNAWDTDLEGATP